jgi:hypothetical protein
MTPFQTAAETAEDLTALNQQVVELYQAEKYAESIPLARRALAVAEDRFGADSVEVGITLSHLAALYYKQGRSEEVEPLLTQAGWKTLLSVTAYQSFAGEVEASNTPTIRRLTPSRRHQLQAIARQRALNLLPPPALSGAEASHPS